MLFGSWPEAESTKECVVACPSASIKGMDPVASLEQGEPRILIAEADVAAAAIIEEALRPHGWKTTVTSDVATTLASVRENHDLLFLNIDFFDEALGRELRRDSSGISSRLIVILGPQELARRGELLANGVCDYITTPLEAAEIVTRAKTHIGLKRANEQLTGLMAEHLDVLAAAQRSCMPQPGDLPEAGFAVKVQQILQAGGDFYDVLPQDGGRIDYIVADASGHSLASSFWTLAFKTLLAEYSSLRFSLLDLFYLVNRALLRILPEEAFFTAAYSRLDRTAGRLMIINAGHTPAIIVPANANDIHVVHQLGDVIGSFPDPVFSWEEISVRRGDRFFLYTDGLVDSGGGQTEGIRQLSEILRKTRNAPMEKVMEAVVQEMTATPRNDDVVLMGVEV